MRETNPLIRAKRRAGRVKRWVKRKLWERNIGKQYKAWLAEAATTAPSSVDNLVPIAVIVPVFNPPIDFLRECLDSVVNQTATHWQLIVSDDGSTDAAVVAYLDAFSAEHASDDRITVLRNPNGGISAACNRGLEQVRTSHFGWLDHDDALDPRCFAEVSQRVADTEADIVYSDEDKITARGEHLELYCKPDFSPELLLTQMYLCHFTVFRTELVNAVGGFRTEMDGAQDFDLALRLLPKLTTVEHIPLPLYHWRTWAQSTAQSIEAKPWAQQAAARAQQEHLDRTTHGGAVHPSAVPGLNEVHPHVPEFTRVSVIIPTVGTRNERNTARFIDDCVRSLVEYENNALLDIIVVTTGVIPNVDIDHTGEHTLTHVVYDPSQHNTNGSSDFNFAEAINLGRSRATAPYLLLLNDDTTVAEPNPVTRLLEIGQLEGVGVTGAKLTYPDGRLQHVGMVMLPSGPTHAWIGKPGKEFGYFGSALTPRNYSAVTAAAMLVKAEVFDQLNGFDTAFARDFNDVDFCLRARQAGHRVAWTPYAHWTHHEGASIVRRKADPTEHALFADRWSTAIPVDPYYSPALNPKLERIYEAL